MRRAPLAVGLGLRTVATFFAPRRLTWTLTLKRHVSSQRRRALTPFPVSVLRLTELFRPLSVIFGAVRSCLVDDGGAGAGGVGCGVGVGVGWGCSPPSVLGGMSTNFWQPFDVPGCGSPGQASWKRVTPSLSGSAP